MNRVGATRTLGAAALVIAIGAPLWAHFLTPSQIVGVMNSPDFKARMGVSSAQMDASVPRLLIVKVSPEWYLLPDSERVAAASAWLSAWRHAQRRGIIAVVDASSGRAVVAHGPAGEVQLIPPHEEKRD